MRPNEQLQRDTSQFLAGLGAVPIMILADLKCYTASFLGCAIGNRRGWIDCAAVVAEASAKVPLRHVLYDLEKKKGFAQITKRHAIGTKQVTMNNRHGAA